MPQAASNAVPKAAATTRHVMLSQPQAASNAVPQAVSNAVPKAAATTRHVMLSQAQAASNAVPQAAGNAVPKAATKAATKEAAGNAVPKAATKAATKALGRARAVSKAAAKKGHVVLSQPQAARGNRRASGRSAGEPQAANPSPCN